MTASHISKKTAAKKDGSKQRLTILPGVGLVDLDDPELSGALAERLVGKVGEQLVEGIAALNEPTSPPSSAPGLAREVRPGTAGWGLCTEDPR